MGAVKIEAVQPPEDKIPQPDRDNCRNQKGNKGLPEDIFYNLLFPQSLY
jgi:hypothetical protein